MKRSTRRQTRCFCSCKNESLAPVVATAEIFFQPYIGADEKVAAAHFLDLELGDTVFSVLPGDGYDRPGIAAHDGFERDLDGEVEMRCEKRPTAVNDGAAVSLEGVGGVVERDMKEGFDKKIRQAVDEEFDPRVIDHPSAFDEAAAEYAVPAIIEQAPILHGVAGHVGGVGHHDGAGIAG